MRHLQSGVMQTPHLSALPPNSLLAPLLASALFHHASSLEVSFSGFHVSHVLPRSALAFVLPPSTHPK
eukprot:5611091-Prymnesium_polylepis.1